MQLPMAILRGGLTVAKSQRIPFGVRTFEKLGQTMRMDAHRAFEVRSLQREYFRHHSQDVLAQSKQAERQLDDLLSAAAQGGLDL